MANASVNNEARVISGAVSPTAVDFMAMSAMLSVPKMA